MAAEGQHVLESLEAIGFLWWKSTGESYVEIWRLGGMTLPQARGGHPPSACFSPLVIPIFVSWDRNLCYLNLGHVVSNLSSATVCSVWPQLPKMSLLSWSFIVMRAVGDTARPQPHTDSWHTVSWWWLPLWVLCATLATMVGEEPSPCYFQKTRAVVINVLQQAELWSLFWSILHSFVL